MELSIKNWKCGGDVRLEQCSRVGYIKRVYENLERDTDDRLPLYDKFRHVGNQIRPMLH